MMLGQRDWEIFLRYVNREGLMLMVVEGVTRERVAWITEWRKHIMVHTVDGKKIKLWKRGVI